MIQDFIKIPDITIPYGDPETPAHRVVYDDGQLLAILHANQLEAIVAQAAAFSPGPSLPAGAFKVPGGSR